VRPLLNLRGTSWQLALVCKGTFNLNARLLTIIVQPTVVNCQKTADLMKDSPDTTGFNRKTLRKALRSWNSTPALGEMSLAVLDIVNRHRKACGYQDSDVGRGRALREVLQAGIQTMTPMEGEPDPLEKRWRPYLILTGQYLEGRAPGYLSAQMGIAESTYAHEQAETLDQLADLLREWEHAGIPADSSIYTPVERPPEARLAIFNPPPLPNQPVLGRENLIKQARDYLLGKRPHPSLAFYGLPGVGKTTLANEIAHDEQVRAHFSDGVLWAGLGRSPDLSLVLLNWGLALGISGDEIRALPSVADRARLLHTALGDKRLLLVVDDIWDSEHAKLLEIGGPGCARILTTRYPALANESSDHALTVPELDEASSARLIEHFALQVVRIRAEETREVVRAVSGLPLALVLIGNYLRKEVFSGVPRRQLEALRRLADPQERMKVTGRTSPLHQQPSLVDGEEQSLEAIIALSDEELSPTAHQALMALSLFPPKPNTFSEVAALHVARSSVEALDELVDSGLMESAPDARYAIHSTIVEYARLQPPDPAASLRYGEYFLVYLMEHRGDYPILSRDHQNLVAALDHIGRTGDIVKFSQAVCALYPYLEAVGLLDTADRLLAEARDSLEATDEVGLRAEVYLDLGRSAQQRGQYELALEAYQNALFHARKSGEPKQVCNAQRGLGTIYMSQGDLEAGEAQLLEALQLAESASLPLCEARTLSNLGAVDHSRGEYDIASERMQRALQLARIHGDRSLEGSLILNLAAVTARLEDHEAASLLLKEGLEIAHSTGNRRTMLYALTNLGSLSHERGDDGQAETYFIEALAVAQDLDDKVQACQLHANLAAVATAREQFNQAQAHLDEGLTQARAIGHKEHLCLLLINQAEWALAQGDEKTGSEVIREAELLAAELGNPRFTYRVEELLERFENG
jgi:tetratricopeptide (TPR) repeat protein